MTAEKPRQLMLGIHPHDDARLENFYAADANKHVFSYLSNIDFTGASALIYLWGTEGSGRSHLLQAMCHQASHLQRSAIYLPLAEKDDFHPGIFEGIAELDLVCLDDVNQLTGDKEWEQSLFHAYNRCHDNQIQLIVAADIAPTNLQIQLPDLQSRLSSGIVFHLHNLTDAEKIEMLKLRADKIGIRLKDKVAKFILHRADRSESELMGVLVKLDRITLEEKRRLTIPLIKETLGW